MKRILFLCGIVLLLLMIGCTKENPELDSKIVLDEYMGLQSIEGWTEETYNINKQLPLTAGKFKQYLEKSYERSVLISEFLDSFYSDCLKISTDEVCYKANEEAKEIYHNVRQVEVTSLEFENLNDAQVMWVVSRRIKELRDSSFQVVKYILTKTSQGWLITDFVDTEDKKVSEDITERIEKSDSRMDDDKIIIKNFYDRVKEIKNDKCYSIQFNKDLSPLEVQSQQKFCYINKYVNFVEERNQLSVCDEIMEPAYKGMCYGKISANEKDISICDNMENEEYEAQGLNEPATSKDICYYSYAFNFPEKQIEGCNKIVNTQAKADCSYGYILY